MKVDSHSRAVMLAALAILSSSTTTAFQPIIARSTANNPRIHSSLLQYTSGTTEDQPILMQLANGSLAATEGTIVSSSAQSFLQMMAAQDNDMSAMDEYLEYVDKRYARMHPQQVLLSSESSPAAAVATAVHNMSTSTTATKDDKAAPLKKLGLSRLASAQLRQRLRQQYAERSTMTLLVRVVTRFLRPLSYVCGALLVVVTFARGSGYHS